MGLRIIGSRDVVAGLIYLSFGGLMFHGAPGFRMGTAVRMGPGYFPRALALIMVVPGLISLARGFCVSGEKIDGVKWKSLLPILVSTALFGLLLERLGLALALVVLVLVSAIASKEFRFGWKEEINGHGACHHPDDEMFFSKLERGRPARKKPRSKRDDKRSNVLSR